MPHHANIAALPPLIGGEIHYGRVQPRYWDEILAAAQSLGAEVIGMYVMWELHEVREGVFDFTQLHQFLEKVAARGFKVLARPGPYFYAEWRNLGIPDHAVWPKNWSLFRKPAAAWIAAVMAELRPYLGNLIVAVQADNEIDPMPHFFGEDQGYDAWLTRRYGTVEAMNAAWGTSYRTFTDPIPALTPLPPLRNDPRFRDSARYRYDLATDYARWVIGEYRKNGCTVPILLNTWPGVDAQHWRDLAELSDFYGIDPYLSNECRTDFRYFRERLRLLRAVTDFPYIAEFGAGVWHGMPADFSPEHYGLTAMTALMSGVRGWNWYMLANRDNWSGAPINERGVVRPELAPAFRAAVKAFHELRDAPPPATSFAVTWSWPANQVAQIEKRPHDDPLWEVLHGMGIEYDLVDVDRDFDPPPLLFATPPFEDDARLWRYVENGGRLVFFQRLIAGCAVPDGTSHPGAENLLVALPGAQRDDDRLTLSFPSNGAVFSYREVPGDPVKAVQTPWRVDADQHALMMKAFGRRYVTGYQQARGNGTVLVLGCPPSREAIIEIHRLYGLTIPALPLPAGIHATRRGDRLVVVNQGEAKTARIQVGDAEVVVDLPRCGGVIHPLAKPGTRA